MVRQPSDRARDVHLVVAILSLVVVCACVVVAVAMQLALYGCPTCTSYDAGRTISCNGNEVTYCGGGLPLLTVVLVILTGVSYLFAVNVTLASRRFWAGDRGPERTASWFSRPLARSVVESVFIVEGAALAGIGLLTPLSYGFPGSELFCLESCPSYTLSGPLLVLLLVGTTLFVLGIGLRLRRPRNGGGSRFA
jgi:hypothetical protein